MDRQNPDRDNGLGGKHTYTPRSHEDLLRSHLQLDASRNARLQSELQRLSEENNRLRRDLADAQRDIKDRDDEIDNLRNKLREKPKGPPPPSSPPQDRVFEVDGKPVTLDQIISHFEGVIQKHHDLLDKKNQQIDDLEDALRNRPKEQPVREEPRQKQEDFAKELALIRKEYEQVEHILSERNNKLENLIEDLKRKLDQYADEIEHLRQELTTRGKEKTDPNESTILLLKEKEKENDYLKNLINSLKNQPQNVMPPGTNNDDLENEIRKIIEDKKNAVKKLSNMIIELKKTPSGNAVDPRDTADVEKECKEMMGDLNNMNDKLNNVLQKLRQTPKTAQGEPVNKDDLLHNLNNLKKQCEDEIKALKNQLDKSPSESPIILTGIGRVRIDDPDLLKRKYPDNKLPDDPVNVPSNVQFYLYPPHDRQQPIKRRDPDPSPESSLKSYKAVDYRLVSPEVSYRQLPIKEKYRPKERLYPEIPSETRSISPKPRRHSPVSCEACQEDYVSSRRPQEDYTSPRKPQEDYTSPRKPQEDYTSPRKPQEEQRPPTPPDNHKRPKKKKGCFGRKGSKTSNVPYEKKKDEKEMPDDEEIVYIHQPQTSQHNHPRGRRGHDSDPDENSDHSPQSRSRSPEDSPKSKSKEKKLVSKLKLDRKKDRH